MLYVNGTVKEKYEIIKQLSRKEKFDEDEIDQCLVNLQPIIFTLRPIYEENRIKMLGKNKYSEYVWKTMHELNKKRNFKYDEDKKGDDALEKFHVKDNDEYMETIADGFHYIFDTFCFPKKEEYSINGRGQCIQKELEKIIKYQKEVIAPPHEFFKRLDALSDKSKGILLEFIRYAPKKLGVTLQFVMAMQCMSVQDILNFINATRLQDEEEKKISAIQYLTTVDTSNDLETIRRVCKTLLISEDLLYTGRGKIYGDLSELLSDEGIIYIKEKAKEQDIKEITEIRSDTKLKKSIKSEIRNLIQNSDMDFQKLIELYPGLFYEKDVQLYDDKDCFMFLLHKEEAFVLLEVLERMEEKTANAEDKN